MAHKRIIYPSVDGDKPNDNKQKKSLTPGSPAQVAKNTPQEEYPLSDMGGLQSAGHAPEVPQAPEVKSMWNKSNPMP